MKAFSNNEEGYLDWVQSNPDGFVLNVRKVRDREYVVLHRASCGLINSRERPYGGYTTRSYKKICALDVADLQKAARLEGRRDGSFSKYCKLCKSIISIEK